MIRITNSMMSNNTKNNINLNKVNADEKNTQVATGQKITRPSDDPVIAIRALRFNTTISQLNQYYEKNIPDAQQWMNVTETALSQTDTIYDKIIENLTTGASDTNTASDRQKILASLKGLKEEFYSTGNADYAGRTVFTGYRTGEPLTFLETDTDKKDNYLINMDVKASSVDKIKYITSFDDDITSGDSENNVQSSDVYRIRLPYDNVKDASEFTIPVPAPAGKTITITSQSITGLPLSGATDSVDAVYTQTIPAGSAVLIPETGELLLNEDDAKEMLKMTSDQKGSLVFNKNEWKTGEARPEHYFACVKTDSKLGKDVNYNYNESGDPDFVEQNLEVEVSFNQKVTINTHASDVYNHNVGRDIDDMRKATQDVVDCEEKVERLERQLKAETSESGKQAIQVKLDAAKKEFALKKDKMQRMFSEGLDIFEKRSDETNKAIADIGSMSQRLKITKERVEDQLASFKTLADENININLTDAAIDLSNAQLSLQAAQLASSKIAQQTLLNYL